MTNEELLERIVNGDEAALAKLCLMNTGLVKDRARLVARQYHCLRQTKHGGLSDYAKETLSELESVGKLALVECVRAGGYDAEKGRFTTYVTPFLDGAMRRHLDVTWGRLRWIGTAWDWCERHSAFIIRKEKNPVRFVRHLVFLSVLPPERLPTPPISSLSMICKARRDGDIFERLASTRLSGSAEDVVIRMVAMECLQEEFLQLSKKEQDILGRYSAYTAFPSQTCRRLPCETA